MARVVRLVDLNEYKRRQAPVVFVFLDAGLAEIAATPLRGRGVPQNKDLRIWVGN